MTLDPAANRLKPEIDRIHLVEFSQQPDDIRLLLDDIKLSLDDIKLSLDDDRLLLDNIRLPLEGVSLLPDAGGVAAARTVAPIFRWRLSSLAIS